jgi:hypothetical protein
MSVVSVQFTCNLYAMQYMKCYMQTAILKPNKSQEPSEAKSQVKPKPQSQNPKAKSQVGMQMGDPSSKMHANHRF